MAMAMLAITFALPSFTKCQTIQVFGGDIRVAKGHFTRGDDIIRLSVIGDGSEKVSPPLDYMAQFAHRWRSKTLHSQLLNVSQKNTINVDGQDIRLKLPVPGSGATGLLVADPCFTGRGGLNCPNGDRFQILDHLAQIINQLVGSDEFDFWGILGDNFYDQKGDVSSEFFKRLSPAAKAKPFLTVPGNHDFWIAGGPVGVVGDQFGYGFMQFYGQDTPAASGQTPYDFQGNPDAKQLAAGSNFILSTQIGDMFFFGYSAAHGWSVIEPHATAFCKYIGDTPTVNTGVLIGHWNEANLGCKAGMDTPSLYEKIKVMEGCRSKRLLYFDGHQHCNRVTKQSTGPLDAVGFMIGGAGMYGDCAPQFGVTVLRSEPGSYGGPNVRVDHFPVADDKADRFDEILACLTAHGYKGCHQSHAVPFRSIPSAPAPPPPLVSGGSSTKIVCILIVCALSLLVISLSTGLCIWKNMRMRPRARELLMGQAGNLDNVER